MVQFLIVSCCLGNIYIADTSNKRIRKVTISTGAMSSIAGTGTNDYTGDGGSATLADLSTPYGVYVDASGILFIILLHTFL